MLLGLFASTQRRSDRLESKISFIEAYVEHQKLLGVAKHCVMSDESLAVSLQSLYITGIMNRSNLLLIEVWYQNHSSHVISD